MNNNRSKKISVLIGCSLMLTISYMALSSWSVAVPALSKSFRLSNTMLQIGNGALIAGYAVGSFIEGKMLVKSGWKKTFFFAMALFLLGSLLIPFMTNYVMIVILRFLMGFGLIVNLTCALVGGWFPSKERGLATGILVGCIGLGSALGGVVTGALNPAFGWKKTFLILSAITVVGIVLFMMLVKTPPDKLEDDVVESSTAEDEPEFEGNIYKQPALWLFALALLCVFFNVYGMYAFLPNYLQEAGYSSGAISMIVLLNGLIAVASTPIGGYVSDKMIVKTGNVLKSRALSVAFVGALVGAIGCLLVPVFAGFGVAATGFAAIVAGWGCPATNSPILSLPSDIFGSKAAGPANGVVILVAGIGGVVSPILVSSIAESSRTMAWLTLAISAIICFVICLILPKFGINTNQVDKKA